MSGPTVSELERRFARALTFHSFVVQLEVLDASGWQTFATTARAEQDLPLALALIVRDVVPLESSTWRSIMGPRQFPHSPYPIGDHCWSHVVWGYDCPRSEGLQLDHHWPYALGGPSSVDNGIWLCPMHNRAKSDDVHLYDWPSDAWPSWVERRLRQLSKAVGPGR